MVKCILPRKKNFTDEEPEFQEATFKFLVPTPLDPILIALWHRLRSQARLSAPERATGQWLKAPETREKINNIEK